MLYHDQRWLDHPGLVLGPGPSGRCDDHRVGGAVVDHDPSSGQWRVWYYCRDKAFVRAAPATLGTGRVALATSSDGIAWTRFEGPVEGGAVLAPSNLVGAFDEGHVGLTDLSRTDQGLVMWTFGGGSEVVPTGLPQLGDVPGLAMRCGMAISQDGIHWRRLAGAGPGGSLFDILPDELYAAWPNAIPQADGATLLQYSAPTRDMASYRTRIVRLGIDGSVARLGEMVWLDGPFDHDTGGIVTRHVIPAPDEAGWLMAYTALDRKHNRSIALARSDDGIAWRHDGAPVLLPGEPGSWDDFGVAANRLVVTRSHIHLYYYGFRSLTAPDAPRGIGLAIARRDSPRAFRRIGLGA